MAREAACQKLQVEQTLAAPAGGEVSIVCTDQVTDSSNTSRGRGGTRNLSQTGEGHVSMYLRTKE